MTSPLPAQDLPAEQALLGAVLSAPDIAGPAFLTVPQSAWYRPRHQEIAAVLAGRLRNGQPLDLPLLLPALLGRRGLGEDVGTYLFTLMQHCYAAGSAMALAERVRACAAARDVVGACQRTIQRVEHLVECGDELDLAPLVADFTTRASDALALGSAVVTKPRTVLDLLAEDSSFDWLVPGLLERMERLILTGGEGGGKSYFLGQFAACLSAGVHPFTASRLDRRFRVTVVDCENPKPIARRRYRKIVSNVSQHAAGVLDLAPAWGEQLFIEFRPEGLDLFRGRDAAWLENIVAATVPDVLIIGPIYKLHISKAEDEQVIRELTVVLDGIRTRYGCALLMEHHMGHAEDGKGRRRARPIGSSVFLRWPEFGYGFLRAEDCPDGEHPSLVDVVAWKGGREERAWPRRLRHGRGGELPWVPENSDYWDQPLRSVS